MRKALEFQKKVPTKVSTVAFFSLYFLFYVLGFSPKPLSSWWERGDSNPHDLLGQRILSPLRLPVPPLSRLIKVGGGTQIRTGDKGFADLCLTTWLCRHK